jgi:hypothetical protein
MNLNAIQDDMRQIEEQVREDFKPKFDALHEKYWPYVSTSRYPVAVRERNRYKYQVEYLSLCGSLMRAIHLRLAALERLRVQVLEHERRVRMSAKERSA